MAEQDPVKYFQTEIKRLNYYNSQFLVDTDFNDEQLYHKQMRRFHNRALHTWGIVEGLRVERVQNTNKVTVSPGVAIDRLGQEIVLTKQSDAISLDEYGADAQVYVTIKYRDIADQADKDTSDTQTEGERYRRWTERPEVKASADAPAADAPEVLLAVVMLDKDKAIKEVSLSRRRYAGSRIGSSGDGKEFGIYADAAGAWHLFDGGRGADRLTVDEKGNVGIGTTPSAARLSILTTPGPYDGALMDFAVGENYRLSIRSKAPERDTVAYHFDLVNNLGRYDNFLILDRGNVGIGTTTMPSQKLQVNGTIYSESGGFKFPDGTTQTTAAASEKIPAKNVVAGTFGENTGGGNYTFPAAVYWGLNASRTETKDDASAIASRSGFFQTENPVNYYPGATSWQHLIESRHSNNANNYTLQIAGSFNDQRLYMRKTSGDGAAKWSRFVLMNSDGRAGIGTENPLGPLSIGDSSVAGSDGFLVLGKKTTATGGTRHFRLGFDDNFNITIGDFGHSNNAGTWLSQLAISYQAPANSLYIDSVGYVGVGTAKPVSQLHVRKDARGALGPVLTLMNNGGSGGAGAAIDFYGYDTLGKDAAARIQSFDDSKFSAHLAFLTKKPDTNDNPLTERMRISSGGRVGIGTSSPLGPLSVGDSSVTGSDGYIVLGKRTDAGGTRHFRLGFDKDFNFVIGDYGHTNTAGDWLSPLAIAYNAPSTSLFINSAGRVGIGTMSPAGRLNLSEATGTQHSPNTGTLVIDHENSGGASSIVFRSKYNRTSDYGYIQYQDDATVGGGGESSRLIIGVENDSDDHLVLQPSGNVGIGTPTPSTKLEVDGVMMQRLELVRCNNNGDWGAQNHPIKNYFRDKLRGKPVGTFIKVIQDHPSWRGHYWQGWVDADGKIRVIHNYHNTGQIAD